MDTPASLLERLRQPAQDQAWARFVELYTPLIYSWARRLGLAPPEAADLVQDVFVLLVQKLPYFTYDPSRSFHAWLRTVTIHKYHENHRRRQAVPVSADYLAGLHAADGAAEQDEAEYRQYLVGRALRLMQSDFQPATWKAFWECVAGGRRPAEVARELGLTVKAVYLARSRVLRRLRQELQGLLD
jgi:RNA polymerase sigma-70 factor (ECF subfamily)